MNRHKHPRSIDPKTVGKMKAFTANDLVRGAIICLQTDLAYVPTWRMKQGISETRTGYGAKLNSGYFIRYEGKPYRIYVTIFSNVGTCWFTYKGTRIVVSAH